MEKPEIFNNLLVKLRKDALLPDYPLQKKVVRKNRSKSFCYQAINEWTVLSKQWRVKSSNSFWRPISKMEIAQRETYLVGVKVAWKFIWAQVVRLFICPFIRMSAWKTKKIAESFWKNQPETSQTPIFSNLHGQMLKKETCSRIEDAED